MDEVVGIRMASDKTVVGVGAMAMSSEEIKAEEEVSGTAAYNLHHVDDQLYEIGEKVFGPVKFDFYMKEKVDANNDDEDDDDDAGDKKKKKKKDGKEKKDKKKKKGAEYEEEEEVDMGAFLAFNKKPTNTEPAWDKKAPKMSKVLGLDEKKNKGGKAKGGKGKRKDSGEFIEEKGQGNQDEDEIPIKQDKKKGKKGKKGKGGKKKDDESEESDAEENVENAGNEDDEKAEGETEGAKGPSPKEMDALLREAFLNS